MSKRLKFVVAVGSGLIAIPVLVWLAIACGFIDWQDARTAKAVRLRSGRTLAKEVAIHLRKRGYKVMPRWNAVCYGPVATVTACVRTAKGEGCLH